MPTHIIKHSIRHRLTPLALVAKLFSLQLKRGQAGPKHVLLLNVKDIDLKKLLFMFTNFNCGKCDSTLINKECLKVHIDKQHEKEGIQPIDNLVIRISFSETWVCHAHCGYGIKVHHICYWRFLWQDPIKKTQALDLL